MFGAPFVLRALSLSSYLSSRIWPGIWPGDHMWDWLLRLLLYWQVCVKWLRGCAAISDASVTPPSLLHSGLGCHYLHLDKGSCSSDPMLEGCRMYKPLANRVSRLESENEWAYRGVHFQGIETNTILPSALPFRVNAGRRKMDSHLGRTIPTGRSTIPRVVASLPTSRHNCSLGTRPGSPLTSHS